jgi:AbrB family looped-hinge helix DNA binding protein
MAYAATLTSKGQTTIPKEIRDALGMKAGDQMTFTAMPDGTVIVRLKNRSIMDQAGSLARAGRKAVSTARMTPWK